MNDADDEFIKNYQKILLEQAIKDCHLWHGDQPYGTMLHTDHCAQVVEVLKLTTDLELPLEIAAWHHDVIEDTNITSTQYKSKYGEYIHDLVFACTGEGVNRKSNLESIINKLNAIPEASIIKIADRIVNMLNSMNDDKKRKMYLKEIDSFEPILKLNVKHEKLNILYRETVNKFKYPNYSSTPFEP